MYTWFSHVLAPTISSALGRLGCVIVCVAISWLSMYSCLINLASVYFVWTNHVAGIMQPFLFLCLSVIPRITGYVTTETAKCNNRVRTQVNNNCSHKHRVEDCLRLFSQFRTRNKYGSMIQFVQSLLNLKLTGIVVC